MIHKTEETPTRKFYKTHQNHLTEWKPVDVRGTDLKSSVWYPRIKSKSIEKENSRQRTK